MGRENRLDFAGEFTARIERIMGVNGGTEQESKGRDDWNSKAFKE